MKLAIAERLFWSGVPVVAGAILPGALIYWVASRGFQISTAQALSAISDYYSRPFDSLIWAVIWHLPPFVLLAIICYIVSRHANRHWLLVVILSGITLITIPMVPRSIHSFKDTYRRDNYGEGAEFFHFGTAILSSVSLAAGLWLLSAIRRYLLRAP